MIGLSSDHRMIQQMIRDFATRELREHAREWDAAERFPVETFAKLGELGMLGIRVPEELGGAGLDALASAIVMEELGRGDGSVAVTASAHNGLVVGSPARPRRRRSCSRGSRAASGSAPGRSRRRRRARTRRRSPPAPSARTTAGS
jgi:alkylation response protein AidB-like acyl-CoA dehydrogenase